MVCLYKYIKKGNKGMKKFSKILTLLLAIVLMLSNVRMVSAYDDPESPPTPGSDTHYEEVGGKIITFKKYLISELGHQVPDLSFTYTIEGGEAIPSTPAQPAKPETWEFGGTEYEDQQVAIDEAHAAVTQNESDPTKYDYNGVTYDTIEEAYEEAEADIVHNPAVPAEGSKFEVFAGIDAEKVVISSADFTDSAPEKHAVVQDQDTVKLDEYEVYQKQNVTVNFSQVKFNEPGIYRYKLTEDILHDVRGILYDTQRGDKDSEERVRYIDVYVINDPENPEELKVEAITTVLHEVKTTVYTTNEMGSRDEKATKATSWELPQLPEEFKTKYESYIHNPYGKYELAEKDRALLSKKIHTDMIALSDELQELVDDVADAERALADAEDEAHLSDKETAMDLALENLEAAQDEIDELISLLQYETDPEEIKDLRNQIDVIKNNIEKEDGLQDLYDNAKAAYDNARDDLKVYEDALKEAQDALNDKNKEIDALTELFELYEPGCILVVKWELSDKSDNYVNEIIPEIDLQFHKKVDGNQGSKDKYFQFEVTIEGLDPYELVYVDYQSSTPSWTKTPTQTPSTNKDYDAEEMAGEEGDEHNNLPTRKWWYYDGKLYDTTQLAHEKAIDDIGDNHTDTQPATEWDFRGKKYTSYEDAEAAAFACCYETEEKEHLIADKDGKIEHIFYLKHDEYVKLLDLKKGATYKVKEIEEDYLKTSGTDKKAYTTTSPEIVAIDNAIDLVDEELSDPTISPERRAELENELAELNAEREVMLAKEHKDPTEGTLGEKRLVPGSETWTYGDETYKTEEEAEAAAKASVVGDDTSGYTFPGATQTYQTREEAEEDAIELIKYDAKYVRGTNVFTGYTNTRNGIIPTGVMVAASTGALILGAGVVGMMLINRRREEDEDEE